MRSHLRMLTTCFTLVCLIAAATLSYSAFAKAKSKKSPAKKAHSLVRSKAKKPNLRTASRKGPSPTRAPASLPVGKGSIDGEQPLKIQGQSRNLNMMLMLKGEKERVEFGESRHDYRMEVLGTQY